MMKKKCHECEKPATRAYCYAGDPWTPYCAEHPPQYGTAGDIPINQLRRAESFLLKGFPRITR